MNERQISAFIIPGTDPHLSEYSADHWKARGWISGFNGSAGTAVVTEKQAGLWTDSRYFLQAGIQLEGSDFILFKDGRPKLHNSKGWSILTFRICNRNRRIDVFVQRSSTIKHYFEDKGFSLISDFTPFEKIWDDRPSIPNDPIFVYPEKYSGESTESKISRILNKIKAEGANAILLAH